ncbi:hypothetical protein PVAP13_4KG200103 [Panicum virgatum]|uniref:Uncharacterized protein n=1 Tax=Panicum virgatum TaxID=38727 RepID=A0A8T0TNJ6_PANVG|nr:hypothetical protein PVAP13_4KG200103 [Panicum virgatum]
MAWPMDGLGLAGLALSVPPLVGEIRRTRTFSLQSNCRPAADLRFILLTCIHEFADVVQGLPAHVCARLPDLPQPLLPRPPELLLELGLAMSLLRRTSLGSAELYLVESALPQPPGASPPHATGRRRTSWRAATAPRGEPLPPANVLLLPPPPPLHPIEGAAASAASARRGREGEEAADGEDRRMRVRMEVGEGGDGGEAGERKRRGQR